MTPDSEAETVAPSPARPTGAGEGNKLVKNLLIPFVIVVAGVGAAVVVIQAKPTLDEKTAVAAPRTVQVTTVEPTAAQSIVEALGTTEAKREITLIPEVSGRVTTVSKSLQPGRRVKKGEILVGIDPRTYQYAVARQQGELATAQRDVEVERANKEQAKREDELLPLGKPRSSVALREDHLIAAEARVAAQKSVLEDARLQVQRTVLRAPFDATVISESVDIGQLVGSGTQVAQLAATGDLRVEVSVALEDLDLFTIPRGGSGDGSPAVIRQQLGRGKVIEREGHVIGLIEALDTQTRRARVLIEVEDPLGKEGEIPMLPGAAVDVAIQGKELSSVIPIPRHSVSSGKYVWEVDGEDALRRREVTILWASETTSYVGTGLEAGARVVTSKLELPLEGEKVNIQ